MKVSVVIPVFNCARYLSECVESIVAAARYAGINVEIVCVNDGSTDDTDSVMTSCRNAYESQAEGVSFVLWTQTNQGVANARNHGVDLATGEWIQFVDADDVISRLTYASFLVLIKQSPRSDMVGMTGVSFTEGTNPLGLFDDTVGDGECAYVSGRFDIKYEYIYRGFTSYLYRRGLVANIKFHPYKNGEDLLFLLSCFCKAGSASFSTCRFYGYRIHPSSASALQGVAGVIDSLGYAAKMLDAPVASGRRCDNAFVRHFLNIIYEDVPWRIVHAQNGGGDEYWLQWNEVVGNLRKPIGASVFMSARMGLLRYFGYKWIVYLLCIFPVYLKRKGVHR